MAASKNEQILFTFADSALKLAKATEADAVLILVDHSISWPKLKRKSASSKATILVASANLELIEAATESGISTIKLDMPESSVQDRLTQAVLECVASEHVLSGSNVVAVYSSFDADSIDTVSILKLTERLVRLTARDLRKLETKVPLDTLKIDRAFIKNIADSQLDDSFDETQDVSMVSSIIHLGELFGLKTVAEGIETNHQLKSLTNLGADLIQGYYFSKPVPLSELPAAIEQIESSCRERASEYNSLLTADSNPVVIENDTSDTETNSDDADDEYLDRAA